MWSDGSLVDAGTTVLGDFWPGLGLETVVWDQHCPLLSLVAEF